MTGRRSHGRLSALNGVVHQGTSGASASPGTDTIPSGSGPAVVVRADDSFVVIY